MTEQDHAAAIAALNDACRAEPGAGWMLTPGVRGLSVADQASAFAAVTRFSDFSEDNDPYAERDFGAVTPPRLGAAASLCPAGWGGALDGVRAADPFGIGRFPLDGRRRDGAGAITGQSRRGTIPTMAGLVSSDHTCGGPGRTFKRLSPRDGLRTSSGHLCFSVSAGKESRPPLDRCCRRSPIPPFRTSRRVQDHPRRGARDGPPPASRLR
jgi:hypothetical protein